MGEIGEIILSEFNKLAARFVSEGQYDKLVELANQYPDLLMESAKRIEEEYALREEIEESPDDTNEKWEKLWKFIEKTD